MQKIRGPYKNLDVPSFGGVSPTATRAKRGRAHDTLVRMKILYRSKKKK